MAKHTDHTAGHRESTLKNLARIETHLKAATHNHGQIKARATQENEEAHAEIVALVKELRGRPDTWTQEDLDHLTELLRHRSDMADIVGAGG